MAKANMRQQLFVEAYIATKGNGTESARRAGYKGSDNALNVQSQRLLRNAWVKSAIAERTEKALVKVQKRTTAEDVIAVLDDQMNGLKPSKWRDGDNGFNEFNPQQAAAILGKFLGLEKPAEPTGTTTVNLLQIFGDLDASTVERIRAATLKALPGTVEAG